MKIVFYLTGLLLCVAGMLLAGEQLQEKQERAAELHQLRARSLPGAPKFADRHPERTHRSYVPAPVPPPVSMTEEPVVSAAPVEPIVPEQPTIELHQIETLAMERGKLLMEYSWPIQLTTAFQDAVADTVAEKEEKARRLKAYRDRIAARKAKARLRGR